MTRKRRTTAPGKTPDPTAEEAGFDFGSPRWREPETEDVQRGKQRRFRNDAAPNQRGSIDAAGSVPRGK
ncbi:MAG: hypothetical protein FIA92_15115 [Chloroflexi bacterium]|nr:hypothetical protein [Chloroflexota bacterium]